MINPGVEWLFQLLKRGPATPVEVSDAATLLEITPEELVDAYKVLGVVTEIHKSPGTSLKYDAWVLPANAEWPPTPRMLSRAPARVARPASEVPDLEKSSKTPSKTTKTTSFGTLETQDGPKKRDPAAAVVAAKASLQRNAPRYARYLRQLAEIASDDAEVCPHCKRGTPRSEEIRLKAILAIMDRAGVTPPRPGADMGGDFGPAIVFPPGTQIAVVANTPVMPQVLPTIVRADQYGEVEQ